jgi:hypothetical protein
LESNGIVKNELTGRYVASISPPVDESINGKYRYVGWKPCIDWCMKHLYHGGHYEPKWHYIGEGVFEFEDESEYLAFLLRWS